LYNAFLYLLVEVIINIIMLGNYRSKIPRLSKPKPKQDSTAIIFAQWRECSKRSNIDSKRALEMYKLTLKRYIFRLIIHTIRLLRLDANLAESFKQSCTIYRYIGIISNMCARYTEYFSLLFRMEAVISR
jgi:hypothetical protein